MGRKAAPHSPCYQVLEPESVNPKRLGKPAALGGGDTGGRCFRKHTRSTAGDCRFESGSALQQRVGNAACSLLSMFRPLALKGGPPGITVWAIRRCSQGARQRTLTPLPPVRIRPSLPAVAGPCRKYPLFFQLAALESQPPDAGGRGPIRRCSSMVEHQPSKLSTRVRFPSLAPARKSVISHILKERRKSMFLFTILVDVLGRVFMEPEPCDLARGPTIRASLPKHGTPWYTSGFQ